MGVDRGTWSKEGGTQPGYNRDKLRIQGSSRDLVVLFSQDGLLFPSQALHQTLFPSYSFCGDLSHEFHALHLLTASVPWGFCLLLPSLCPLVSVQL